MARSAELCSVAILLVGLLSLATLGGHMQNGISRLMKGAFVEGFHIELDPLTAPTHLITWFMSYVGIVAPMILLLAAGALAINITQVGILFASQPLMPKGDRISPLSGVKRILSKRGLVELSKSLFKVGAVAYVTYLTITSESDRFMGFMDLGVRQIFSLSGDTILTLGFRIVLLLLAMAILDYAFQRWDYEQNLRMTRQEVKEELKQQEGDPMVRSRIRAIQREMSQRRMMADVEQADVVVTNPTHLAVALRYDPAKMAAPVVLAKGQRLVAERIKELARQAGVPLMENKPLARALFKVVQVGDEIPQELFRAAAEVLAFVFQLKQRKREFASQGQYGTGIT